MQDLCHELRLRLPKPFLAVIGGRLYLRGDSYLRPGLFLVPFTYFRFALRLEQRWRAEWLPELRATSERWERDPEALGDGDLLRGIDELARAGARYWRAAYLPRFAGFSEQLFTIYYELISTSDDPHPAVLLGGTADVDGAIAARTAPHLDFVNPTAAELTRQRGRPRRGRPVRTPRQRRHASASGSGRSGGDCSACSGGGRGTGPRYARSRCSTWATHGRRYAGWLLNGSAATVSKMASPTSCDATS